MSSSRANSSAPAGPSAASSSSRPAHAAGSRTSIVAPHAPRVLARTARRTRASARRRPGAARRGPPPSRRARGEHDRAPVGEGMRGAVSRMHPPQPVALEPQPRTPATPRAAGVDRGEHVVPEARERSSPSVATAPPRRSWGPRARRTDRPLWASAMCGAQPVGAAADDDTRGRLIGRLANARSVSRSRGRARRARARPAHWHAARSALRHDDRACSGARLTRPMPHDRRGLQPRDPGHHARPGGRVFSRRAVCTGGAQSAVTRTPVPADARRARPR